MTDFSKDKLLEFLDYLATKGLMNRATVAARKAATNTVLGILEPDEVLDLRNIDLDEVASRFANLKGTEFKPDSVKVYKSRVSSALEDFKKYKASPQTFKPSIGIPKTRSSSKGAKENVTQNVPKNGDHADSSHAFTFPVPIRPDVVIKISGIPSDLTKKEASKVANVILALATENETMT